MAAHEGEPRPLPPRDLRRRPAAPGTDRRPRPLDRDATARRHWAFSNPVAVGAGNTLTTLEWVPRVPPVVMGIGSAYVQIAATTTGPSYYANLDFIELTAASVS